MIITVYFELLPCILNHYREFDDILYKLRPIFVYVMNINGK